MLIIDNVDDLMPNTDDIYIVDIRYFFLTIASLIPSEFMGISVEIDQQKALTPVYLKRIYNSYKGKLTRPENLTRAFIASTYHLPALDINNPSKEWLWVAKLCHLLMYFVRKKISRRISETTAEARKWVNPASNHHSIWSHCYLSLQASTLNATHKNFEDYRVRLENSNNPNLKSFIKMYRTIDFAAHSRENITRASSGRKQTKQNKIDEPKIEYITQSDIDDDVDQLTSVTSFEHTRNDNDINRERLDDPVPDFNYIEQKTLRTTEKFSSIQIYRRTRAKFAHANKNERFISSNIRQLPITAIQNIASKLWQWFTEYNSDETSRERKRAIGYLLLSLYTGHSVSRLAEDVNDNRKAIIDISTRKTKYEFVIHLDITPLRIRTTGIESVIASRLMQFRLPLPEPLGAFLSYKGYPDTSMMNEVITQLRMTLGLPMISVNRLEKSLYTILIHEVSSTQLATIITSRNSKKRADIWYSSHDIRKVAEIYRNAITLLTARCHNSRSSFTDYLSKIEFSDDAIGSQNSPDYPIVGLFMDHLQQRTVKTHNYREQYNFYNLWLWHVFLLLTSIRAVEGAPGYLNQVNIQAGMVWISDKEERATANSQRLAPICSFLDEAIQNFLGYLKSFAQRYGRLEPNLSMEVNKIFDNQRPLLNVIDKKGNFCPLRPAIIIQELDSHFRFKPDWTRHVGQRFLHESGVDEAVILAIFGHEMMGQEAWRKNSSLSIGHILATKSTYQQLATKLELQQVIL